MNYNPELKDWQYAKPNENAGTGQIESPDDQYFNIPAQNRASAPTAYETDLCNAMHQLFLKNISELPALVDGLNKMGVVSENGKPWSQESFCAEMARLGY